MKPIDLGKTYGEMSIPMEIKKDEKHYPTLHIEGDEALGLPESGEMTISFKRIRETHTETDGKVRYECTLEVRKILDFESDEYEEPKSESRKTEDVLDALMKKMQSKDEEY